MTNPRITRYVVQQERIEELKAVCGQAYVIVGQLLQQTGDFGTERGDKLLDNLVEGRLIHDDIVPWEPSTPIT